MRAGDKVRFMGVRMFWYKDILDNGMELKLYDIFTVKSVKIASSWTAITLEETGDLEYNDEWFRPYENAYCGRDHTEEVIGEMFRT